MYDYDIERAINSLICLKRHAFFDHESQNEKTALLSGSKIFNKSDVKICSWFPLEHMHIAHKNGVSCFRINHR